MACEICRGNENLQSAVRDNNRALRTVNRNLRRTKQELLDEIDKTVSTVEALITAPNQAEIALKRVCDETGMQWAGIGTDDYDNIADVAIAAIKAHRR